MVDIIESGFPENCVIKSYIMKHPRKLFRPRWQPSATFDSYAGLFLQIAALEITFPVQWDNSLGLPQHLGRKSLYGADLVCHCNESPPPWAEKMWRAIKLNRCSSTFWGMGISLLWLEFWKQTRERPAAVFRERLGVDGRLDFLPPVPTQ